MDLLQRPDDIAYVTLMQDLTEALRTNMTGGKTVGQMLAEAAAEVPFIAMEELNRRISDRPNKLLILDVREEGAFRAGHIPSARHLPRGQLELRVNDEIPDPTLRIVAYCEFGKISTLAAATLRQLGFMRAIALDGGMKAWRDGGYPVEV
jgi:rhodanese-related sulfurtransferase